MFGIQDFWETTRIAPKALPGIPVTRQSTKKLPENKLDFTVSFMYMETSSRKTILVQADSFF